LPDEIGEYGKIWARTCKDDDDKPSINEVVFGLCDYHIGQVEETEKDQEKLKKYTDSIRKAFDVLLASHDLY